MKFELFGKLRDGEEQNETSNNKEPGLNMEQEENNLDIGQPRGGLEKTVERMFDQGYSEEEIRQELDGQYSSAELQGAINQVVKSSATGNKVQDSGPQPMQPYKSDNDPENSMSKGFDNNKEEPEPPQKNNLDQPQQLNNPPPRKEPDNRNQSQGNGVEELVETIVAENFEMVEAEFQNVYKEIDEVKEKLEDFEERINELEIRDDEDNTQVIQKMDEIEQDFQNYQSRIGGLEKAFQQVLPSLVDNVRELTGLVQEIKQEKGIETSSNINKDELEDIDMEDW